MRTFASRRIVNTAIVVFVGACIFFFHEALSVSLRSGSQLSGWLLFALMLVLALYNFRKKFTFLPLGTSSGWLQFHIYAGFLTVFLFVLHLSFKLPDGPFEILLALLYLSVAGSGLVGLFITRFFPPRLSTRGEEIIFERIPTFIVEIRQRAEDLLVKSVSDANSTTVSQFCEDRLRPFFARPRHFWRHVLQTTRPRYALLAAIESQYRYLNDDEKQALKEIESLVCVKDDLDYQYALQAALKLWLFVHIPLTYALLIFTVVHLVLVHAFAGVF